MLGRRVNERFGSTIPCDLVHASLQPVALELERFTLANLGERDDAGVRRRIQEDDTRLLIATPDEAHAAGFALARYDQVNFAWDRNGIREDHLRPVRRHVFDPAINREARVSVLDGAAKKRFSALDLTTFDHLPLSHRATLADPKSPVSKLFAEARPLTGLQRIKVNVRSPLPYTSRVVA